MNSPDSTLPLPPERLAVLDRLPEGVEFSLVKLILSAAPPFTRTRLWTDRRSLLWLEARTRRECGEEEGPITSPSPQLLEKVVGRQGLEPWTR